MPLMQNQNIFIVISVAQEHVFDVCIKKEIFIKAIPKEIYVKYATINF